MILVVLLREREDGTEEFMVYLIEEITLFPIIFDQPVVIDGFERDTLLGLAVLICAYGLQCDIRLVEFFDVFLASDTEHGHG